MMMTYIWILRRLGELLSIRCCVMTFLALAGVLPSRAGETVLPNQPPLTNIVHFEVARGKVWQRLPRTEGEYLLSATKELKEWAPKSDGSGAPGCILPPPNDFTVRAITKNGASYYMTFTTHAELVWVGSRLLALPGSASTHIVQRVESVLRKK